VFDAHPDVFGSYRVIDQVGAGRFGPVFRGTDESQIDSGEAPGGTVAIKVFDQGLSAEQAETLAHALTRLCDAPLDHPSIVAPNGAGLNGRTAWLAEPYVEATPLETVLGRRGRLPLAEVLIRVTQVAGAIDFAAAAGVYHGTLHTRDILFAGDRTLVTGFGVAQAVANAGLDVPVTGAIESPQRKSGQPATHADDVFALAAMTFEALYGQPLPGDGSPLASFVGPLHGVDHVRLREVLQRGLAEYPAERPGSALEFARSLQECMVTAEAAAEPAPSAGDRDDRAAAAAMPFPIAVDDFPLRAPVAEPSPEPDFEPVFERESRTPTPDLDENPVVVNSVTNPDPGLEPRSSWFPLAAMLAIGLLAGFAAGFVVGQRDFTPPPRSAERAVPRAEREMAQEAVPTPTVGQDFTESAVDGRASVEGRQESDAPPPSYTEGAAPDALSPAPSAERPAPDAPAGPASMEVVSRPPGAQVFVDGRMVGRTPLVVSEVHPGDHSVRIALPGHQRWATTVNVPAGSRSRVAASLER
jgi:serine/threonine-protein kinase